MPEFRIVVHLHDLMPSGTPLGTDTLVSLSKAVRDLAEEVHTRWVAYATEEPLPDGRVIHSRSGTYRDSIQIRELGEFAQEVYSDAPHASALEEGMPERDLSGTEPGKVTRPGRAELRRSCREGACCWRRPRISIRTVRRAVLSAFRRLAGRVGIVRL